MERNGIPAYHDPESLWRKIREAQEAQSSTTELQKLIPEIQFNHIVGLIRLENAIRSASDSSTILGKRLNNIMWSTGIIGVICLRRASPVTQRSRDSGAVCRSTCFA